MRSIFRLERKLIHGIRNGNRKFSSVGSTSLSPTEIMRHRLKLFDQEKEKRSLLLKEQKQNQNLGNNVNEKLIEVEISHENKSQKFSVPIGTQGQTILFGIFNF